MRPILQELKDARLKDPTNVTVAIDHNHAVEVTLQLFQDLRSTVFESIVEALESPDPYPIDLWVEE